MPLYSPSWDEGLRCDTIRLAEMTQAEKAHMQALEFYAMRDPSERLAYGIKEVVYYPADPLGNAAFMDQRAILPLRARRQSRVDPLVFFLDYSLGKHTMADVLRQAGSEV